MNRLLSLTCYKCGVTAHFDFEHKPKGHQEAFDAGWRLDKLQSDKEHGTRYLCPHHAALKTNAYLRKMERNRNQP